MNYIELKINKPFNSEEKEILVARLLSAGFEGFSEEDDQLLAYIPEKYFTRESLLDIDLLKPLMETSALEVSLIEDQNWNAVWESNYHPVKIAGTCFVRAPFHDPDPDVQFDVVLRPKMAFGTAHHETTALMIGQLLQFDLTGLHVLDMGCGTGVLAIIASMKKAASVTAIDNDEWACQNTVENAGLNDITGIKVLLGDAGRITTDSYDLILANINKNILLADMGAYGDALRANGQILFSGFFEEDLPDILSEAEKKGLKFVGHHSRNNWVVAVFKKQ